MLRGFGAEALRVLGFLIVSASFNGASGRKTSLTVDHDQRSAFLVEPFCFADGGSMRLKTRGFKLATPSEGWGQKGKKVQPDGEVGFLIRKVDGAVVSSANVAEMATPGQGCMLTDHKRQEDRVVPIKGNKTSYAFNIDKKSAGLYSIIYANCHTGTEAAFSVDIQLMNRNNVYLSAGDIPLPMVYGVVGLLFLAAAMVWIVLLRNHQASALKIHFLMGALCCVKSLTLLFEAFRYQSIKKTGEGYGWSTIYYALTFIKGLMLFSVILLIGTGWSFIKPFLADRDKKILLAVLPLQVIVNTAMVIVEETPPGTAGWMTWRDILHFFDVLCCCAILFPIVWSIRHLREAAEADGKAKRTLDKLKLFREFYILVVLYVYFTRFVLAVVGSAIVGSGVQVPGPQC